MQSPGGDAPRASMPTPQHAQHSHCRVREPGGVSLHMWHPCHVAEPQGKKGAGQARARIRVPACKCIRRAFFTPKEWTEEIPSPTVGKEGVRECSPTAQSPLQAPLPSPPPLGDAQHAAHAATPMDFSSALHDTQSEPSGGASASCAQHSTAIGRVAAWEGAEGLRGGGRGGQHAVR